MPKKSLADTHPEVAKKWHPTKNGDLTPEDVTKGSKKRISNIYLMKILNY
jgi:hypothetical protein